MPMVCPQCNGSYEQRLQCPGCEVRLLYQAPQPGRGAGPAGGADDNWQQTPWSRIVVGLFLAQGLYYGLRQLCTAGLLAAHEAAPDVWSTLGGLLLLQGLQTIGVVAAGLLAGAGQRQGFVYGGLLGIWNGALFILVQSLTGQPLTAVTLFGVPVLQMTFGVFGGFLGSCIWKPLPTLRVLAAAPAGLDVTPAPRVSMFSGPVAWVRVLAGSAVVIGGTFWANVILGFVLEASDHQLRIDHLSRLQAQLITWEISVLATLAGGALAGATTYNGVKQGLCVGLVSGSVLTGISLHAASLNSLVFTLISVLTLGLAGGWFGGQLLPPLGNCVPYFSPAGAGRRRPD